MNETRFGVRPAREEDLTRIMEIYATARKFMAEHGNPRQWGATNWPPEALIRKDIAEGKSFVLEYAGEEGGSAGEKRITAVFFYDFGKDVEPCYPDIREGSWVGDDTYGVVHRIASDGTVGGSGAYCINWAFRQCGHLRMDTHGDNTVMQNLLRKLGFVRCGTIYVEEDNDPRIAYEKTGDTE